MTFLLAGFILVGSTVLPQDTVPLTRYDIAARLLLDSSVIAARVTITVPTTVLGPTSTLELRLPATGRAGHRRPRLDLTRLADARGRALRARRTADGIRLSIPVTPGRRTHTIVAEYRISLDSSDLSQVGYFLFTGIDSDNAWYPVVTSLVGTASRFADFDVTLQVPLDYAALTSGAPDPSAAQSPAAETRYVARHVEGFALALGRGFRLIPVEYEGIRVTAFAPPADSARFRSVAEETAAAAAWYKHAYGFFPTPHIGIVPGVAWASGGFPLPNVVMVHRGNLSPSFVRFITAHELGHYFWGLWVLDPEERLGWLVLANGIWADQYQLAQRESTDVVHQWRRSAGEWLLGFMTAQVANYEQRLGITRAEEQALGFDYNTLVRHGKAATALYLLSRRIGWERFLALQRELLHDFRDRPLPLDTFIARIAGAGYPEAPRFFAAWVRSDARIGYRVARVRPDTTHAYWIVLDRTGTVPYPVDVDVISANGSALRLTFAGEADADSQLVRPAAPPEEVRLDPDGAVPMWDSWSSEIRRLYVRALYDAGLDDPFLALALGFLAERPDQELRALVVTRLFDLAQYSRAADVGQAPSDTLACRSRLTCRAAILVARSLTRSADTFRAASLLDSLRPLVSEHASQRQWDEAATELAAARR